MLSWIAHGILIGLALLGASRLERRIDQLLILSVPLYFVVTNALIFPLWRHYFPVLGLTCVFAASGALFCYDLLRAKTI